MTTRLLAADRVVLLALARRAVEAAVRRTGAPASVGMPVFDYEAGAFVTLTAGVALRGCIGSIVPARLGDVIVHCAAAAALEDPRFPPLLVDDLSSIAIAISVLSPCTRIEDPALVEVGRHGLIVERGRNRGLLLPQVATEWGWSRDEFLSQTCRKAGLPSDAWRVGAQLFTFEAEIFGEGTPS
jgi:uncharacterized protein